MLARKPAEIVLTQLRIRESLRSVLEREAEKNQISLNREIVRRLEESMEGGARQDLSSIKDDITTAWLRFGDRFLALELEEGILAAVEQGDLETARAGVQLLRKRQAEAARWRTTRTYAPTVEVARPAKAGEDS